MQRIVLDSPERLTMKKHLTTVLRAVTLLIRAFVVGMLIAASAITIAEHAGELRQWRLTLRREAPSAPRTPAAVVPPAPRSKRSLKQSSDDSGEVRRVPEQRGLGR
jgi:hypothetical protein